MHGGSILLESVFLISTLRESSLYFGLTEYYYHQPFDMKKIRNDLGLIDYDDTTRPASLFRTWIDASRTHLF